MNIKRGTILYQYGCIDSFENPIVMVLEIRGINIHHIHLNSEDTANASKDNFRFLSIGEMMSLTPSDMKFFERKLKGGEDISFYPTSFEEQFEKASSNILDIRMKDFEEFCKKNKK